MSVFKCTCQYIISHASSADVRDATVINHYSGSEGEVGHSDPWCDDCAEEAKLPGYVGIHDYDYYLPILEPLLHSDVTIAIEIALYTLAGQGREWVVNFVSERWDAFVAAWGAIGRNESSAKEAA